MSSLLEKLVASTALMLMQRHMKLVTAESCTGGGLGYWLTSIAGSSDWYERGFITYSNAAKIEMLDVSPATLSTFGAVSTETAQEMADGALRNSDADIGIAITGIAGPTGGTAEKPVGTVWFAWAKQGTPTTALMKVFDGNRQAIRESAIAFALQGLEEIIGRL